MAKHDTNTKFSNWGNYGAVYVFVQVNMMEKRHISSK